MPQKRGTLPSLGVKDSQTLIPIPKEFWNYKH